MVSQITLGNIATHNGKTTITGGQSGLDTEGLIKALTEARRLPAVNLESLNTKLGKQKTALSSLQSILTRFQTAVDTLRNPPGVSNASKNIFEYRSASVTSSTGEVAGSYLGVTVQPGAAVQNFTIDEISQLAVETKQESSVFSLPASSGVNTVVVTANGAPQPGLFQAGTFSLRVTDGGADAQITLNENESLQTVANKFNAVKDRTGIQATIVKVADGLPNNSYKLIFTGTTTGENNAFDLSNASTVTSDGTGVLAQLTFNTTQQAKNAKLKLDGVEIERQKNGIDDLVGGITFQLKQTTPNAGTINATKLNVSVQPDTSIAANAITQLADVYNEFRLFVAKQTEIGEDGLPTEDAVLANNNTLRTIASSIGGFVTGMIDGLANGSPNQLADVGIDLQDFAGDEENPLTRNIMVVDSEKLNSALLANFEGVRSLFEYQLTADNPNLTTFKRTNELAVNAFTLTIDRANNVYQATYIDENNVSQTVDLNASLVGGALSLKGQSGTPLAGLELLYAAPGDATINVSITQGFGDRLYNGLSGYLDSSSGTLTEALSNIEDQVSRNKDEVVTIDSKIEIYRQQLVDKYAKLESALSRANSLLSLLDAQASARENA